MQSNSARKTVAWVLFSLLLAGLLATAGCGGSSTPAPAPTPTPGAASAQLRIGDAPVDSILAFEFTVGNPVVFTPVGGGAAVSITTGSNRFEMTHLAAKFEPLGSLTVPVGSYSSATLPIESPELVFVNATGTPVSISGTNQTVTVNFAPPLSIAPGATIVNLDVNVANSITTSAGVINGINFTGSSFTFTTASIAAENQQEDESGEIEGLVGKVTAVSGTTFILNTAGSNSELNFTTDTTTQFKDGLTTLASALNQIVRVEGTTRADGTLFAKSLEGIETQNGSELDGLITLVTRNPATSLTLFSQDGIGNGMDPAKIGASFTADVTGLNASKYTIDQGKMDFSGLTVPGPSFPFDATTIHAGQRVEIENVAGVPPVNNPFTADKIKLQQQAIGGTISNFVAGTGGAATFDLTLAADSHLAILSGQTAVHVFQQPGTNNKFGTINGSTTGRLRVRGLLFWTGTQFNMIARRITP